MRPVSSFLGRAAAAVAMSCLAGLAAAHPGHAAPDIVHDLETLAAAPLADGAGLGAMALWFALIGVALLAAGPAADAAGKTLPGGVRRLARPLGLGALALAALAAFGPF